jgi:hypothetical protein
MLLDVATRNPLTGKGDHGPTLTKFPDEMFMVPWSVVMHVWTWAALPQPPTTL